MPRMTLTRTKKTMRVTAAPRMPDHRVPRKTLPNTQMFRVTALDASTVMPMSFFRTLSEGGREGAFTYDVCSGLAKRQIY